MKIFLLVLCTSFPVFNNCRAQTFAEWFQQKKTQIEYLVDQIAAYDAYLSDMKKGYDLAKKGLETIHQIKEGDFNLHSIFFQSLLLVNPSVRSSSVIADILLYASSIQGVGNKIFTLPGLNAGELAYARSVCNNLFEKCAQSVKSLIDLVTDNFFQMTDDQRIFRINQILTDMKDRWVFAQSFYKDFLSLSTQRQYENNEINSVNHLFGLQY